MKKSCVFFSCFLSILFLINVPQALAQSPQVALFGKVLDAETGEPLIGASIVVAGSKTGTVTDVDGSYSLLWHQDKEVVLECNYTGYEKQKQTVETLYKREVEVNFMMSPSGVELEEVVVTGYAVPMVESDKTTTGAVITSDEIKRRPAKDALAASGAGSAMSKSRSSETAAAEGLSIKKKKSKSKMERLKEMSSMDMAFSAAPTAYAADVVAVPGTVSNISAGTLTAGEIHDFSKWELWQDIATEDLNQWETHWNFHLTNRYTVQVLNEKGFPIVGAEVFLENGTTTIWQAKTDNTGKAELWNGVFDAQKKLAKADKIKVNYNGKTHEIKQLISFNQGVNFLKIAEKCNENNILDIAFVVDATGSMGDEIAYLQTELKDVIEKIQAQREDLTINLGSVFYKKPLYMTF